MTNKLSLTFILTPLLLAVWLSGCGKSETIVPAPTGQVLKGTFVLVKAVGHEATDVGGPNPDDHFVLGWVSHTYEHPEFTGTLILGAGSFELYAPLPLQSLHITGSFEVLLEEIRPYAHPYIIALHGTDQVTGRRGGGDVDYEWCGNTLKLENLTVIGTGIYWTFHWQKILDP